MRSNRFIKLLPFFRFLSQPPIVLLGVGLLTYGVFIPMLNFFWDDLSIHWIADVYGNTGLARYFSTNRPVWGLFYQIHHSLLGNSPWLWQIFGIFWRWVAATGLYLLLKQLFNGQKEPAFWGSVLFMVYPGFGQQFIAMVYGHFFLIFSAFLYSFVFSIQALNTKISSQKRLAFQGIALFLSVINLFSMEYFFMLELVRPVLFWFVLPDQSKQMRLKTLFLNWLPYLIIFFLAGFWRAFIFNYQTENYDASFLNALASQPLSALRDFILRIFQDFWTTLFLPWKNAFSLPSLTSFGSRALLLVSAFSLLVLVYLCLVSFFLYNKQVQTSRALPSRILLFALVAFLLAGVPFWLTGLPVNLFFPYDRFTIPFLLAFTLFWVTLIFILPIQIHLKRMLLIVLIAFSSAHQLQTGIQYQRDWDQQSRFFWQLLWRAPAIKPGTILFAHELPITYFSDGSLTSGLNWIYNPNPSSDAIAYVLYYPTLRVGGTLENLQPNQPVQHDLLVGEFQGNTSQSLALFYQPPACLRILDPEVESDNWMVPLQVRDTVHLSNTANILAVPQAVPPLAIYAPEENHGWCYYFEKADLARQQKDWDQVVTLGETAFGLADQPNDPAERMPFIEGYAHTGDWQRAELLTLESARISPLTHPVLCRLWARIDRESPSSPEHKQTVQSVQNQLDCSK